MLAFEDVSLSIAGRPLIEAARLRIPAGHKLGLVGRNGSGKTTLFRAIRGEIPLDAGRILLPEGSRVGGVAQEVPSSAVSLLDTVLAADTERARLLAASETAQDGHRIAEIQTRLADIDAWSAEARAASILAGLGFPDADQRRPCSDFSGGWRMRVALAGVLFSAPDLLLLDEPTNYLDLEGAVWLEGFLARYPHTALIISHDRGLLNRAVQGILNLEDRQLSLYTGPYDTFARTRAEQRAVLAAEAKKQAARRAHLQSFVDRFRAQATKARQAQSRVKMLEKMTPITAPAEAAQHVFAFPAPEALSPPILALEGVAVGYGGAPVLSRLNLRIDPDDRIALLGRNGQGKSTLSKLLAGKLQPSSGRIVASGKLRVGFFAQHQIEELMPQETPVAHVRRLRPAEGEARLRARLAGFGLFADQAGTVVARLSGGQKARLSLLLATIDAPHLLILDEPTNHLDMESREALVEALTEYPGAVVLVSHDMHLVNLVADRLWLVQDGTVTPWQEDLEAYRRMLLSGPETPTRAAAPRPQSPEPARAATVSRAERLAARAEVRRCEERLTKLSTMRDRLADKLADGALYEPERVGEAEVWQKKYAEVLTALDRAESLWLQAQERLEEIDG